MTSESLDLLMCHTCGTQFDTPASSPLSSCRICDDPRQWVPPTGQRWTSLRKERDLKGTQAHKNHIEPLTVHINSDSTLDAPPHATPDFLSQTKPRITSVVPGVFTMYTTPTLGIGERVILIQTPSGTVMWDLLAYLDEDTISTLKAAPFNGLKAIIISHPHYYTNHLDWAEAFDCPIYIHTDDREWLSRKDTHGRRKFITGRTEEIVPGLTAINVRGHFPGSLVLHWKKILFIADSLVTQPSALYHINRPKGTISYTFMWSIPNMIPLPPSELFKIWQALEPFDFEQTHGAFMNQDVYDPRVKERILESMKIQATNATGHDDHEIVRVESV